MFLYNIKLRIENNNSNLQKTVLQLWSQIGQKVANYVYKMTLKKKVQTHTKKIKKAEKILRNESETNVMDLLSNFSPNQRPHFQNSFS